MQPNVIAVVLCAGRSTRFENKLPKQLHKLRGTELFMHSVRAFEAVEQVDEIVVVVNSENFDVFDDTMEQIKLNKPYKLVAGGIRRQDSVENALKYASKKYADDTIVLIHDGARPLVTRKLIEFVLKTAYMHDAVVPVLPCNDTVKWLDDSGIVTGTVRRTSGSDSKGLFFVQTPQAFKLNTIKSAHTEVKKDVSDDAALVAALGVPVHTVAGDPSNIKVTRKEDLSLAADLLAEVRTVTPSVRQWGVGYDAHALAEPGPLRLGGLDVPFNKHLVGHSDGDVLIHALSDAILGAAGLGDLGKHFPPTAEWAGDSEKILRASADKVRAKGWEIEFLDATVVAQQPHLANLLQQMEQHLASILNLEGGQVNIKATTTDLMGVIGQSKGIGAHAIATLSKQQA